MPNIKSVKLDVKKSRLNHARNISTKSKIKTLSKKTRLAIAENSENAQAYLNEAFSTIDKAVKRGIIHANQAARRKSRLAKKFASAKSND